MSLNLNINVNINNIQFRKKHYRYLYILESRSYWNAGLLDYDPLSDLVLTYDFGLKKEIHEQGGEVYYMDHLAGQHEMQLNNFIAYKFLREWYLDKNQKDIFTYNGIDFGFVFRLEIWNEYISYIRCRVSLNRLEKLSFERIYASNNLNVVIDILEEIIQLPIILLHLSRSAPNYFFPIDIWMNDKIRNKSLKHKFRDFVTRAQGSVWQFIESKNILQKPTIFVQEYFPTKRLVEVLQAQKKVRVILAHFSSKKTVLKYFYERPLVASSKPEMYRQTGNDLIKKFQTQRVANLTLDGGDDISEKVYKIIEGRLKEDILNVIDRVDSAKHFIDKNPLKLVVLIANIGQLATAVDAVCRSYGIPSYLIINGLMSGEFLDESKYATIINSYSESIKNIYFKGMSNIVVKGDPRMDQYKNLNRALNRESPKIVIGQAAHSIIDLNSYLAVEFEFINDILSALKNCHLVNAKIVIKCRSNGYKQQYVNFCNEYFPDLSFEIVDNVSMFDVLETADLYISTYSQTLFEASCLGIPCIYYKNDSEILDPPYDGNSELVTACNENELKEFILDFILGHDRFDSFLNRKVMEQYVGPLDGFNLERNLSFIYEILDNPEISRNFELMRKMPAVNFSS